MKKDALAEAQELVATLRTHTELVMDTVQALERLKHAIAILSEYAGFRLVFEQGTEPRLVDYLAITIPHTLEGALYGSVAGLLIGAFANRPGEGAAIGASVGAVCGTVRGIDAVEKGWRVRAVYRPDGALHILQF